MLAAFVFLAVPASALAASSPTGGAALAPGTGNVNVYFGQLKGAGLLGDNITAIDKATRTWQPCAVKVCGGYVAIRQEGQYVLVLRAPRRDQMLGGNLGYATSDGLTFNYTSYYDHHQQFSLTRVPLTRQIVIDGRTFTARLSYVEVQLYDPYRPFPQGCGYNGCGPTTMK